LDSKDSCKGQKNKKIQSRLETFWLGESIEANSKRGKFGDFFVAEVGSVCYVLCFPSGEVQESFLRRRERERKKEEEEVKAMS
jgi:hypothetical protein